jgi:hypothetical protein
MGFLDYDVEICKIICSTGAIVIVSQQSDQGCELVFCVVDGVADVAVRVVPVDGDVRSLGVSRCCSRVGVARCSPRASARALTLREKGVSDVLNETGIHPGSARGARLRTPGGNRCAIS